MAKNSKKKKRTNKKRVFISRKILSVVLLAFLASFAVVYAVNYFEIFRAQKSIQKEDEESTKILMSKMKKMLDEEKSRLEKLPKSTKHKTSPQFPPVLTQKKKIVSKQKEIEKQNDFSEIKDYKNSLKKQKQIPLHVKKKEYKGKPKLAIIIDDVAFAHQTRMIKKIPFKVSPSFFPPTKRHPDTVRLSNDFPFMMVHLPTEALSFGRAEPKTLLVGDSYEKIKNRIKTIKKWFPRAKYYNNHTGSKFTANYQAMDRLMHVMREENLHFVDSRTTAKTKAPEIAKKYKTHLYARDVFLDNSPQKQLIREQLKKAVKIAKKRGYAVAIGHPHESTLEVLIGATNLIKGVKLVYLKEL